MATSFADNAPYSRNASPFLDRATAVEMMCSLNLSRLAHFIARRAGSIPNSEMMSFSCSVVSGSSILRRPPSPTLAITCSGSSAAGDRLFRGRDSRPPSGRGTACTAFSSWSAACSRARNEGLSAASCSITRNNRFNGRRFMMQRAPEVLSPKRGTCRTAPDIPIFAAAWIPGQIPPLQRSDCSRG